MKFEGEELRKTIGQYSYGLNDRIGKGYSSVVFRGMHDEKGSIVAIKVVDLKALLDATAHQMLRSEISIIKKLRHPNIIRCENVYMTVNNCYIVTEYCDGGDLASHLKRHGRLPEKQVISIVRDIFNGFRELANRNIVHRDIKPANILLSNGSCRIADFGFAKFDKDPGSREKYNVGTPLYMSPQALLLNIYSIKNDIWSLGILFYELLHGSPPWLCRNEADLIEKINKIPIKFTVNVCKELQELITGCLKSDENERIDVVTMAQIINRLLENQNRKERVEMPVSQNFFKNQPIVKTHININRLIFKICQRLQDLICPQNVRQYLKSLCISWLRHGIEQTAQITQCKVEAQAIGITNYDHFVTTTEFKKLSEVIRQYSDRYHDYISRSHVETIFAPSLNNLLEGEIKKFKEIVQHLQIHGNSKQQHILAVDYLVTLVQLAYIIINFGIEFVSDNVRLDLVVDTAPTVLQEADIHELQYRKATLLNFN